MANILEIENLKKHYATQRAVDDVTFSIPKGSIFGLLGPNGAGKTTLLRMITGIFYPDSGNITFEGKKFDPALDIARIGYMPEERGLYKKMKVAEQALYLAMLKGLTREKAVAKLKEWFVKFEMQTWWNKKVDDLSKGMSQKLQFVTTVMHEPSLLILDEPFSGLDPVNSNLIKDEIYKLAQTGTTIIFSTHRMEQVEEICNDIILMNQGKKVLDGSVTQIKQDFKENLFRIGFDGPPPTFDSDLFEEVSKTENFLTVRIKEDIKPSGILREFLSQNAEVTYFNEILPTLNDIFIRKVEHTKLARQFENID